MKFDALYSDVGRPSIPPEQLLRALLRTSGTAEREAAEAMVEALPGTHQVTVGSDKAYDAADHVAALRDMNATPHVAQNITMGAPRATPGYRISQVIRKRIEEANGWIKTVALMRKTRHRGTARVGWMFTFTAAAYNLIRLPKLLPTG
jgi:Transposase DDE domain